jgi:Zn-dependent protease with chaperone function
MTDQEFEALVQQLQVLSTESPGLYRLRVTYFATLGYGFLIGSVVLLILLSIAIFYLLIQVHGGAILVKIIAPLMVLLFIVLRSLWVKVQPPTGMSVFASQAPALFELLEEVRKQVNGPRIHEVLVNDAFNAGIVQVPRLGIFGWQRNYLVIGLPLMQMLPLPEFKAVMAHEMGHLVGSHGRFGIWVYRQGQTWSRLQHQLEAEKKPGAQFFTGFLRWYAPRFNAHTYVMMRAHEYDADSLAASVTTPRVAADALVRIAIIDGRLSREFWPAMELHARYAPLPPDDFIGRMAQDAGAPDTPERTAEAIAAALKATTASTDSHPSLKARLEGLGEEAQPPASFEVSAAVELLGPQWPVIRGQVERKWQDSVAELWKVTNAAATAGRKRLDELESIEAAAPLDAGQFWERACLLSEERRAQEAEAILEQLVRTAPEFAMAQAAWGAVLLGRDDERGLGFIDRGIELGADPAGACQAAFNYLKSRDRHAEAARYVTIVQDREAKNAAARAERSSFAITDPIEPHALPESDLEMLRQMVGKFPDVLSATLVRKQMQHFPESPTFILAVRIRTSFWRQTLWGKRTAYLTKVRAEVLEGVKIGSDWLCLALDMLTREQGKAFESVAGEPFYRASVH